MSQQINYLIKMIIIKDSKLYLLVLDEKLYSQQEMIVKIVGRTPYTIPT